jgi:hypothetical protein
VGTLGRASIPPNELSVKMYSHRTDILDDFFGKLNCAWQNISRLWQQLGEDAMEHLRVCRVSLAGCQ